MVRLNPTNSLAESAINQNETRVYKTYILWTNELVRGVVTDSEHKFTIRSQQTTVGRRSSFMHQLHTSQILHETQFFFSHLCT